MQKLLAAAGVASRRQAENLISSGRVTVNGITITQLGAKADPEIDVVALDGKPVDMHPEYVYILLNKPRGYTSTRRDPFAKRLITDLVQIAGKQVYPVGRLDVDTEGMIILTNDGDFAFRMTHPKHHVTKRYQVEALGVIPQDALDQLSKGVLLDDGLTAPAITSLRAINTARNTSIVDITITEGRKRQIRRMFFEVGHPLIRLTRTSIGKVLLGRLKPGEWRFLSKDETDGLILLSQ
ncbi:MAG: pseudouridine synthase [Armatimonadota bacterium]